MHDHAIDALVEIPKGSRNKYEYDEATARVRLDRVLYSPLHYPADYGFIPETLAEDGDHLDVLIVTHEPTFPGCVVPVRLIGMLDMRDDKGRDQKLLAVPTVDPRFDEVRDLSDIGRHALAEIEHFFHVYKELENKETEIFGWSDAHTAHRIVEEARARAAAGRMA
jgi:inorganic pyrophosphatase